ncbi:MAG: hypothetical protein M3275_03735, partial [Thermoproteota archaeon]|nr:hypothetical protein [Thermoproteota archaeon]
SAPTFRDPLRLGTGQGYEPGIRIDSVGTIFYTSHDVTPFGVGAYEPSENRTASWLYRSADGGKTWEVMEGGLAGENKLLLALEGDIAIDAKDRMYFVDTWAADNHITRWSDHGKTMDFMRPAVATYEIDDRPWIAAHGDGFVYYMSNTGYKPDGRLTIHRSTDGGMNFDPVGFTFPRSGWGIIDADPNSTYVYGFMNDQFYNGQYPFSGNATEQRIWISPDRGATWSSVKVATLSGGDNARTVDYPQVAVSPVDGSVYTLWSDNVAGAPLTLGRSQDHGQTWETWDVTPPPGAYNSAALTVGFDGTVAIGYVRGAGNGARIWVTFWRPDSNCLQDAGDPDSMCTGPSSITVRAANEAAVDQEHFFQIRFDPTDNSLNIPYENSGGHNKFVRQASGPNMTGTSFCGHTVAS